MKNENPVLDSSLDKFSTRDVDFRRLAERWPELPEHIKAAIKTLIETQDIEKLTTTKEGPVEL
jgi:hypothetical protein